MNKKLSGAKLVLVPIRQMGINYLPYQEDLKDRHIKFVDFYPATYLPGTSDTGATSSAGLFFTIANEVGNQLLIKEMPMSRFDYSATMGNRQQVGAKMSFQNSYIYCTSAAQVGNVAALVFYYDLPNFSARNTTDQLVIDSITVPLTTATFYNKLPDSERMTGKRFRRILLSDPATTPDYLTGLDLTKLANIYLTLRKGSYCVVDNMPVKLLYQLQMIEKSEWCNIIFDMQNSYLTIGGAGTISNVDTDYIGKSVFFNLAYEK